MIERSLAAWQAHLRQTACRARAGGTLCARRSLVRRDAHLLVARAHVVWPKCNAPCSVTPGPSRQIRRRRLCNGIRRSGLDGIDWRRRSSATPLRRRRAKPCVRRCESAPCGGRVIGRGATLALARRPRSGGAFSCPPQAPPVRWRRCGEKLNTRKSLPGA